MTKQEKQLKKAFRRVLADFSAVLLAKLMQNERKYRFGWGWRAANWEADLQRELPRHVAKGDPRDTAIYSLFAWLHGWRTAAPGAALVLLQKQDYTITPVWCVPGRDAYPLPGKEVWVAVATQTSFGPIYSVTTDYYTDYGWNFSGGSDHVQVLGWKPKEQPKFPDHLRPKEVPAEVAFEYTGTVTVPPGWVPPAFMQVGPAASVVFAANPELAAQLYRHQDEQATISKLVALGPPPPPVPITAESLSQAAEALEPIRYAVPCGCPVHGDHLGCTIHCHRFGCTHPLGVEITTDQE